MKNKILFQLILAAILGLNIFSCAMMPRTVLSSDSNEVIESQTVRGKYKIYVYPVDKTTVTENSKSDYLYKIGSHDQLSITVWGHPEFSSPTGLSPVSASKTPIAGTLGFQLNQALNNKTDNKSYYADTGNGVYTVDEDGSIYLPMCGSVKVAQETIKQVRKKVIAKLSKYIVNPQVSVNMVTYRSKFAYVVGEVNQANTITLTDVPLDAASALAMSGWVNLTSADVKNIYILRQGGDSNIKVFRLDVTTPTAMVFASGFVLEPSDVVFVSTAGIAQFDRVMTHFLSAVEILWYTKTALNPNSTNIIPSIN